MTPPERASFLIERLGTKDKAAAHVNWVMEGMSKQVTIDYWKEVLAFINSSK